MRRARYVALFGEAKDMTCNFSLDISHLIKSDTSEGNSNTATTLSKLSSKYKRNKRYKSKKIGDLIGFYRYSYKKVLDNNLIFLLLWLFLSKKSRECLFVELVQSL